MVVKARTEGMAFNGACRTFGIAKNTLINWEMRLASLKKTLFLFALVHEFLKLIIEGDELYTKVKKNVPVEDSRGWTILLMDRASRFIWFMECGKKDKKLFKKGTVHESVIQGIVICETDKTISLKESFLK